MDATFVNNFGTAKPAAKRQVAEDDNDSWSEDEGAGNIMNCFEEDKGDCDEEPRDWEEYNDEDDETEQDAESEIGSKKQKPAAAKKKAFDEYDDEDEEDEDDDEELESK